MAPRGSAFRSPACHVSLLHLAGVFLRAQVPRPPSASRLTARRRGHRPQIRSEGGNLSGQVRPRPSAQRIGRRSNPLPDAGRRRPPTLSRAASAAGFGRRRGLARVWRRRVRQNPARRNGDRPSRPRHSTAQIGRAGLARLGNRWNLFGQPPRAEAVSCVVPCRRACGPVFRLGPLQCAACNSDRPGGWALSRTLCQPRKCQERLILADSGPRAARPRASARQMGGAAGEHCHRAASDRGCECPSRPGAAGGPRSSIRPCAPLARAKLGLRGLGPRRRGAWRRPERLQPTLQDGCVGLARRLRADLRRPAGAFGRRGRGRRGRPSCPASVNAGPTRAARRSMRGVAPSRRRVLAA